MKTQLYSLQVVNTRLAISSLAGTGQIAWSNLKTLTSVGWLLAVILLAGSRSALASDPVGVFALIDKVVMEPNDKAPERIQIWG